MSIFKDDQRFLFVSVLLHGLMVLILAFSWPKSSVPHGVARKGADIVELSVLNPLSANFANLKKTVPQIKSADTDVSSQVVEKATESAASTQQLGFAEGTRSMAQIGLADGTANSEKDRYLYELRVLIEQKKVYPQISKRLRETGTVVVRFQVLKDGRIEAVDLKSTSSFSRLNEAALVLVRGIEKFRPMPQAMANDQASLEILLPIEYVLN